MRHKILFFLLFIIILAGCSSDTVDTSLYNGKSLRVGVVGEAPAVREDQVKFTAITLEELKDSSTFADDYDAVFIMKEYLSAAAGSPYAQVYKNAGIPFFFIESMKSYVPFVYEDLSYEEVPDMLSGAYATGYYQSGGKWQTWGYGLYNDKVNKSNVEDVFSRMFTTIASIQK